LFLSSFLSRNSPEISLPGVSHIRAAGYTQYTLNFFSLSQPPYYPRDTELYSEVRRMLHFRALKSSFCSLNFSAAEIYRELWAHSLWPKCNGRRNCKTIAMKGEVVGHLQWAMSLCKVEASALQFQNFLVKVTQSSL
jgi:hypothetical protein